MFKCYSSMRKRDLDTGMVVETRCGTRELVLRNGDKLKLVCLSDERMWSSTEDMAEDMTYPDNAPYDIMTVLWPEVPSIQGMRSATVIMWKRNEE